jgi:hypothetical protein
MELDQTCWRGMEMAHPAGWELSKSSGLDEPGQCCFTDRLYHRLDIRWTHLKHAPNLEAMSKRELHRKHKRGSEVELTELTGVPAPWLGIVREGDEATIVNAARGFRERRMMVEVVLVWPEQRQRDIENAILASIQPQPDDMPTRRWEAMGLRATVPSQYELTGSSAPVGRVRWTFRPEGKHPPKLILERLAMPQTWLKGSLRDWLALDLPAGHKVVRQDPATVNGHRGECVISRGRLGIAQSLRGLHEMRASTAWVCPTEDRLYRISFTEATRNEETSLPGNVEISCCRPAPEVNAEGA